MPREVMTEQQVAAYLHVELREVIKLASRGQIPCRKTARGFEFRKGQLDHWVEARMGEMGKARLAGLEKGVSAHHGFDHEGLVVGPLIPPEGLAVPLRARTREGVLRDLVGQAELNDLVLSREDLLDEIRRREELCSTAVAPGVALPHPRHPLPYDVAGSFVVVGLAPSGIPFGAEDGSLSRLFFLICCKDDRTHVHVLARLGRMLHDQAHVESLLAAEAPEDLRQRLLELEEAVVG
jgi:PTS system nitrogen regulatory IIA component